MAENDIFCKIVRGEINSEKIDEGDSWIAINDIHPQAPIHILIIPKEHITGLEAVSDENKELLSELLVAVRRVAQKVGLSGNGYRIIINQGKHGGQLVEHLHLHLLGGKQLGPKIVKE